MMIKILLRVGSSPAALVVWLAALGVQAAHSQEVYGGLRGRVIDPAGAGAPGARISLLGTAFRAVADSAGGYAIDFVPAGVYTVRAQLVEAVASERPQVWVVAGETIELDLDLGAGGPAVPDSFLPRALPGLASRTAIPGRLLDSLPVDDVRQALTLSPGVVLRGDNLGVASAEDLSIRGGGLGEAAVYIDGAPARFQTFGVQGAALGTTGLAEASVTTGVPTASVADARGGVIAYVTGAGGPTVQGWVRGETDELFGDGSSVGYNRFTGVIGGPFSPVRNLTWLVSGTLLGQRSHYYGLGAQDQPAYVLGGIDTVGEVPGLGSPAPVVLPRFVQSSGQCGQTGNANTALGREIRDNYGFACVGLRRPMDWTTSWRAQGKLLHTYGAGSSLSLTLLASEHQERTFPGASIVSPGLYQGARAWSRLAVGNWGQRLGRLRGAPLHLHVNLSVGTDRQIIGALDAVSEAETYAPTLGVQVGTLRFTGLEAFPFPITDRIVRNIRSNFGLRTPYYGRSDLQIAYVGRLNPYGMATQWPTNGVGPSLMLVEERRASARWTLAWRPGRVHRVVVGGDADAIDLSFYEANLIDLSGLNGFRAEPRRWGLFAADRVELGKLVIDAGVRYDHYTPGAEFPKTPGRIFSVPQWDPASATDDTAYANSVARVFDEGRAQGVLSPRLRVLYQAARATNVRFAYGQQVAPPSFERLLSNVNGDFFSTVPTRFAAFGRDVSYGKVSLLELGVRHALDWPLAVDVSVYRKNDLSPYVNQFRPFPDPAIPGDTLFINTLTLRDGDHATGLDAKLDWRPRSSMQGSVSYSLIKASPSEDGVADVTTQTIYAIAALGVPSGWKQGSVIGLLARDLGAFLTFRATSGLPYTPLFNQAQGVVAPGPMPFSGRPAGAINTKQLPWTHRLDLRLTKGLQVGGSAWTVYLDVRNLLNTTNVEALFAETGDVVNDLHRTNIVGFEQSFLRDEASLNGVLLAGNTVDLRVDCATWQRPVNCASLLRVENRFGDGDGLYTVQEQERALNAAYDSFYGPPSFYGAGRTVRIGVELGF